MQTIQVSLLMGFSVCRMALAAHLTSEAIEHAQMLSCGRSDGWGYLYPEGGCAGS